MKRIETHQSFGGRQEVWQHESDATKTLMKFGIYLPPKALDGDACPVLYWLSGLTCNEQNFITKSGFQQFASEHNLIVVSPDTSPRGEHVPNDEAYDLGQGAGFYVNATEAPWATHFQMYHYIVDELPKLIAAYFNVTDKQGIFGHSMGGHGALTIALNNPDKYQSVSAFSPIVAPSQVPWGQKAFTAYLGHDKSTWKMYDTVELIANSKSKLPLLVDQGTGDEFLVEQLKPELLQRACDKHHHSLTLRLQEGYDHSYYFIASFIKDHFAHHAKALNG